MSKFECTNIRCIYGCKLEVNGQKKAPEKCQYTGMETHWARVESEQFGISEQLPKLTEEVFNRPDCSEWAKFAAVDSDNDAYWFETEPKEVETECWWSDDYFEKIPGKFDASDWQNSLIERLPETMPEPEEQTGKMTIRFKTEGGRR